MNLFSSLKQQAISFLEPYKTGEPATYAAAEQAIGAILILDGFVGIDNPLGGKKRPGIFGTIGGIVFGIIFMFVPLFFGNITNINNMTAVTSATVVSVGIGSSSSACPLVVHYTVNGQEYTNKSAMSSSNYCSLSQGQTVSINYDPANPGSWVYGAQSVNSFLQIFFWAGLVMVVFSIFTFFVRLLSIIFGWKLLQDGRKNAAKLPPGTNLETMINEIKQNFSKSVFGFGGTGNTAAPVPNTTVTQPPTQQPPSVTNQ